MIGLNSGDAIRAVASVDEVITFSISGYAGTNIINADGNVQNVEGDIYLAGANNTALNSLVFRNTHNAEVTLTLFRKKSGGSSIELLEFEMGIGYTLLFDGRKAYMYDASGVIQTAGGGGDGAVSFIDLDDVPASYADEGGKIVAVKDTVDGLEFITVPQGRFIFLPHDTSLFYSNVLYKGPFTAKINGAPTSTSVVYNNDTNENCLPVGTTCGRIVLHNTTKANSRYIVSVDKGTNTITTIGSTDDWENSDNITTQSQLAEGGGESATGYQEMSLTTTNIPVLATGIKLFCYIRETNTLTALQRITLHPYSEFIPSKIVTADCQVLNVYNGITLDTIVIDHKLCIQFREFNGIGFARINIVGYYI